MVYWSELAVDEERRAGVPPGQIRSRGPVITFRKVARSLTAAMPGWLILICGVCFVIPLARLAALLFTAGLCLIQPARVRRAASAWKGGKSHRTCDELSRWPVSTRVGEHGDGPRADGDVITGSSWSAGQGQLITGPG